MVRSIGQRLLQYSKSRSRINLQSWFADAVRQHVTPGYGSIINIGAGGEVAQWVERAGLNAMSIDIDPDRNPDIVADVEDLSFLENETVSHVFCVEVLEHIPRPHIAVGELYRIMQPGAVIIGSTPFLLGIHDAPSDYFRYTKHGLMVLFEKFEMLDLRERNGYFHAISVLVLRRFAIGSARDRRFALLLSPLLITLAVILELLGRLARFDDGTTGYFFIFRKPYL